MLRIYRSTNKSELVSDNIKFNDGDMVYCEEDSSLYLRWNGGFTRFSGDYLSEGAIKLDISNSSLFQVRYYKYKNYDRYNK